VRRRYKGDPALDRRLNAFVRENGGEEFFRRADWRALLAREMERAPSAGDPWESEEESRARLDAEVRESKGILESRLGRRVRIVCWPGEEREPWLEEMARAAGFEAMTVLNGYNRVGDDPARLARLYFPMFHRDLGKERWNFRSFVVNLNLCQGNYYFAIPFGFLLLYLRWAGRKARRGPRA
jgi:hypothetical protein